MAGKRDNILDHSHQKTAAASERLDATQILIKNITNSLPQYLFWKDANSTYLGCNMNFAEFVGLNSPDDIVGLTDYEIGWKKTGATAETFRKGDQATLNGSPVVNQEEVLVSPGGQTLITLVCKLPILDPKTKQALGVVGYFTDISDIKRKELELLEAKKHAEEADKAKSIFMMNISHDIRTPLTGIIGMAKIIADDATTPRIKEAADNLIKAGNALLDLHTGVMEIAHLDSTTLLKQSTTFEIKQLLHNLELLSAPALRGKQLALHIDYDPNLDGAVIGDEKRLFKVMLNLVNNAIKFTTKGHVTVSTKLAEQSEQALTLLLKVEDTGIGIPKNKQKIIFSQFTRLAPTYESEHSGVGLGLSIVKQFIDELSGSISVESEPGKGAAFSCSIPLKKASSQNSMPKASPISSQAPVPDSITNILLVEDNHIAQLAVTHQLGKIACHIDAAENGEVALQKFTTHNYDLVLMDVGLPDMSGYAVTQRMREWEGNNNVFTPIIALTAHIDKENKHACIEAGMNDVFTKPLVDRDAKRLVKNIAQQMYQPTKNPNAESSIDLAAGTAMMGGNQEAAKAMLDELIKILPDASDNIEVAYLKQDWQQLQQLAHKLYGGARYCGVPKLKQYAKQLEICLKEKEASKITSTYKKLVSEINNVLFDYN